MPSSQNGARFKGVRLLFFRNPGDIKYDHSKCDSFPISAFTPLFKLTFILQQIYLHHRTRRTPAARGELSPLSRRPVRELS